MDRALISDEQKIRIVRGMFDAWMAMDWKAATDVFTPDGKMQSMMIDPWVGRDAIYAMCVEIGKFASNIDLHIKRIGVVDGAVITERVDNFLWNGRKVSYPTVGIFEFQDGKINHWKEYFDRAFMLKQMGVTETTY